MFRITEDPSSAIKITRMVLSCPLTWTRSVLWQHILTRCACVWFTVYEGIFYNFNCIYMSYIVHQLDNKVFNPILFFKLLILETFGCNNARDSYWSWRRE